MKKYEFIYERVPLNKIYSKKEYAWAHNNSDLMDIVEWVAKNGIETELLVTKEEDGNYCIINGDLRVLAAKQLLVANVELTQKVRKSLENPLCMIISEPGISNERYYGEREYRRNLRKRMQKWIEEDYDKAEELNIVNRDTIYEQVKKELLAPISKTQSLIYCFEDDILSSECYIEKMAKFSFEHDIDVNQVVSAWLELKFFITANNLNTLRETQLHSFMTMENSNDISY